MPLLQVRVHYLDYGNEEVVCSQSLVELPMSLASLPPQAHLLVLRGLQPTAKTAEENKQVRGQTGVSAPFEPGVKHNRSLKGLF